MATIKFGAIVTDMRGKLGGHVFQKGNQSHVLKTNSRPRQVYTANRNAMQANVVAARDYWSKMSLSDKNGWGVTASDFTFKNAFSDNVTYNGFQFFMRCCCAQLRSNWAVNTNPYIIVPQVLKQQPSSSVFDIAGTDLAFNGGSSISTTHTVIMVAVQLKGVKIPSANQFVHFSFANFFPTSSTGYYNLFLSRFGSPLRYESIYFKFRSVNTYGIKNDGLVQLAIIT